MRSSWQTDTGHPAIRWSEVGQRSPYKPSWMNDTPEIPAGYLMPVPDFAARSPFGGSSWFQPWSPTGIPIRPGTPRP
jgi:hypothetical protein